MNTKETAKNLFERIKKYLADAKNYNKDKIGWNRKSQTCNLGIGYKFGWIGAKGEKYEIYFNGKTFAELDYLSEVKDVFTELRKLIESQQSVKGWATLVVANDTQNFGSGWSSTEVRYISKITLADVPCKEFKALRNYIQKYGVNKYGSCFVFAPFEFFSSAMGGKRGRLWDEYGDRNYLENKPKKCARVLEELRKYRGTKDTMLCERGKEDYIDEIDRKYSEYHEVECEGEKRYYLNITIKTPQGKVKYQQKVY